MRRDRCTTPTPTSWSRPTGCIRTSIATTRERFPYVWHVDDEPGRWGIDVERRRARRPRVPRRRRGADPAAQELRSRPARSSNDDRPQRARSPRVREPARVRHVHELARAALRPRRRPRARGRARPRAAPRDPRLVLGRSAPACRSRSCRSATWSRPPSSTREAIDGGTAAIQIGQYCPPGHSPSHVALDPVWAMCAEAGVPVRAARRGRGRARHAARLTSRTVGRPSPTSTAATRTSSRSTTCRSRCR